MFFRFKLLGAALFAVLFALTLLFPPHAGAQNAATEITLRSFGDGSLPVDGAFPIDGLTLGPDGDLYGTTSEGGALGGVDEGGAGTGVAFKIDLSGRMTILHSFKDGTVVNDGSVPWGGLVLASDGNFYGDTLAGGIENGGVFYKMTPTGQITILHSFHDGSVANDGLNPRSNVIQATDGNFYGMAPFGGSFFGDGYTSGAGAIFSATPSGQVTILHSFGDGSVANDGLEPLAGLTQGSDGNFYGTTLSGGSTFGQGAFGLGYGVAFKITSTGQMTILHSFGDGSVANDGQRPSGTFVEGPDGDFYGETAEGGSANKGVIFKMAPSGQVTILHSFDDGSVANDGAVPNSSSMIYNAADGNFYGLTTFGGDKGDGTVFKMAPSGQVTILYSFGDSANDGAEPNFSLVQGLNGNYYGMTSYLGAGSAGTLFEVIPSVASGAPRGLTAIAGNNQITLHWSQVGNATSYNLYRGMSPGTETLYLSNISGNSDTDTNVVNGTTYYYEATAVSAGGESAKSNEASATPTLPISAAPTNLVATAGNAQVGLIWTASAGATSYNIYRSTSSGTEALYQSGVASASFTDTTVTNGTTYYYKVTAVNSGGESGKSNEASGTPEPPIPPAPTNLIATPGNAQVSLSWTASAGATSYNIYRSTVTGAESIYRFNVAATSFTDSIVTNGTTYFYEVTAVNSGGESGKSNEANATPEPPIPPAPTGLTASAGNAQVSLNWTASANATSYNVYRGTSSGAETLFHSGVQNTTFTDTAATNGTTYFYEVTAVNVTGESGKSNEASATPEPSIPNAPTGLIATAGDAQVGLTWTASTGATSYKIYRSTTSGAESIYQSDVNGTSYTDTGVTNGTTFFYKVTAVNGGGESSKSNEASATPEPPTPAPPTNLIATGGNRQVALTWTASAGATSYNVYRGTAAGSETLYQQDVITASYTDPAVVDGTPYFYEVTAVNEGQESGKSNEASATPFTPLIYQAGLQMFSVPYDYAGVALTALFGYANPTLAVWSPANNQYAITPTAPADQISLGQGYWARFPQQVAITTPGTPADPTKNFDIPLAKGWNMIGAPFVVPVPVANLTFNGGTETFTQATTGNTPLVGATVWGYPAGSTAYTPATSLVPQQGYWIFAFSATDVEVPHP